MKIKNIQKLLLTLGLACTCSASVYAQTIVAQSVFKHIAIDGSFNDWTGVPLAYSQAQPSGDVIQFKNLYVANDENYLYIRFDLYTDAYPFTSKQNFFFDADNNAATGYSEHGIGSEMLIQSQTGYRETNGIFNSGAINGLGWLAASNSAGTSYEVRISLNATYTNGAPVFVSNTIALFLESSETPGNEWFPNVTGGLTYTLASQQGIMVPAYFSPSSHAAYWNELDFGASQVPLIAIMNNGNPGGPGTSLDTNYVNAITEMHQAGGAVIGYVYTSDGSRALADVETDIDTYLSWYDVDGFFLDEMANDTNHYNYYQSIYQYVKAKGAQYSVTGNPGANTQQSYISIPTVDAVVDFEGYGTNYPGWSPSSWTTNYPPEKFVNIPHYVTSATLMTNYINDSVSRNAGWIYVGDNSYADLPSYWTNEVNYVKFLNGN